MMTEIEARYSQELEEQYAELIPCFGIGEDRILTRLYESSHDFAKELIALGYPQLVDSRIKALDFENDLQRPFYPLWIVGGMPSKKGRSIAEAWMRSRGVDWKGNIKLLRIEVEEALIRGETVPHLGFNISLQTVCRSRFVNQSARSALTDNPITN